MEPIAAQPLRADKPTPSPWDEARRVLETAVAYLVSTVRPDGRPHVMPVLAVWLDGALYFCASASSRKARNLAHAPHCVIAIEVRESEPSPIWHLVAEGEATIVRDEATLHGVAEEYTTKYDWHVTLRDGAIQTEGAPTAGPPPYDIYRVALTTVFALGKEPSYTSTRWRF